MRLSGNMLKLTRFLKKPRIKMNHHSYYYWMGWKIRKTWGPLFVPAESAGVHGIIIPERRSVGLTEVVSKASSGAIEHIPIARVTNLTKTMVELKKEGLWFTGADMNAAVIFHESDLKGSMGIVIGGEGSGISRLVKEHCDQLIRLPMWGKINSLNVAVATGIMLYEVRRQRYHKES